MGSSLVAGMINLSFGLVVANQGGEGTWSAVAPMLGASTAASFAGLGLEYSVTRSIMSGESWWHVTKRIRLFFAMLLVGIAASIVVAAPAARYLHLSNSQPVPLSATLFGVTVLSAAPSGLLVGKKRIWELAVITALAAFARIGLLWVVPGDWVSRALLCSVIATALSCLAMTAVGVRGPSAPKKEPVESFGSLAISGSVARLVLWVTVIAPVVAARHFLSQTAAGELATVTFIASSLAYLAAPVATAFFPLMLVDKDRRHLRNGLAVSAGLVVLGTAAVVPAGPLILRLLYHTTQPDLTWLLLFGCLGVLSQTASGFLVWAALARNNGVRAVYAAAFGSLPLVGLLFVFHSSPAAVLVAALPSTAALGVLLQIGSHYSNRRIPSISRSAPFTAQKSTGILPANAPVRLIDCSVGVMAHNEEATIERCLRSLLGARDQFGTAVHEVIVVVSGTDRTEELAREEETYDQRVRVLRQVGRPGKAAAINFFLSEAERNLLVLSSADVLLAERMLVDLLAPLADPLIGMCGGAIRPTNPKKGLCNRLVHLIWELHSAVATTRPKLGEIVAFRRCFEGIDESITVDEVSIEQCVTRAGLALRYVPTVVVYNHGPTKLWDYVLHRYRINRGHLAVRRRSGYKTSTFCASLIARHTLELAIKRPATVPLLLVAATIELSTRVSARVSHLLKGVPSSGVFAPVASAKVALATFADEEIA